MSKEEARLRLFELLWVHSTVVPFKNTAEMVAAIEYELLPWAMGTKTPREVWPDLLPPKDTP